MTTIRCTLSALFILSIFTSCNLAIRVDEKDKIFHAGPKHSGLSGIFWGLYKENKYQFCDGDFMDHGCYTGLYSLYGDTVVLHDLKSHNGIPTNKFIIRRYSDMDSNYWIWKYPNKQTNWQELRQNDLSNSATGDVFPLDEKNNINIENDNYFLIRLDSFKK